MSPPPPPTSPDLQPDPQAMQAQLEALGHQTFRPGQREAIETLLARRDACCWSRPRAAARASPTSCRRLLLPGTTLVVSPLIALMQDQVDALERCGVRATYLASTARRREMRDARLAAHRRAAQLQLVYVAPERLGSPAFRELLRRARLPAGRRSTRRTASASGDTTSDPSTCRSATCSTELPDGAGARLHGHGHARSCATRSSRGSACRRTRRSSCAASPGRTSRCAWREVDGQAASATRRSTARSPRLWARPGEGRGSAIVYSPTRKATEAERERLDRPRLARRGLPRRPGRRRPRAGPRRLHVGRRARGRGRHQRLRHGDRPRRRAGRDPPGAAGLDRGLLPGGRSRRPRWRADALGLLLISRRTTCRAGVAS